MVGTPRLVACCVNMRLSPEQVLVNCPQCGTWPMSLAPPQNDSASFGFNRLSFKCPKCRRLEVYRVGAVGRSFRPQRGHGDSCQKD